VGSENPSVYASIQLAHRSYPHTLERALSLLLRVQRELTSGETRAFKRLLDEASGLPSSGSIGLGKTF